MFAEKDHVDLAVIVQLVSTPRELTFEIKSSSDPTPKTSRPRSPRSLLSSRSCPNPPRPLNLRLTTTTPSEPRVHLRRCRKRRCGHVLRVLCSLHDLVQDVCAAEREGQDCGFARLTDARKVEGEGRGHEGEGDEG